MKKYIYKVMIVLSIIFLMAIIYSSYCLIIWNEKLVSKILNTIGFNIFMILLLSFFLRLILKWIKINSSELDTSQENIIEDQTTITEKKDKEQSYFGGVHNWEVDSPHKQTKIEVNYEIKHDILSFNVPKLLESKSDDSVSVQKYGSETVLWISDGASTSLYSWLWWKNILKYFSKELYKHINDKKKFLNSLSKFVDIDGKERSRIMQAKKLPWHAYAKLSKWSDASLTWVYIRWDTLYYAIIWDSPLIIVSPTDKQVFFYPYKSSAEFSQNPILINTDNTQNEKLKENIIIDSHKLINNEKIIICTDGIGKFLLSVYEKNHDEFFKIIDTILKAKNPISNLITELKNKWHHFGDEKVIMKDDDTSFIYFTYKKKLFPWR